MPVRNNGYYADPALSESFDNLAKAFATPTGSDVAGYANAKATQEKAARLSTLFANPNDPNFDRQNIAVGNYTPIQSFFAQNQNDGTTRRGQDVTAGTARDVAGINNAGELARLYATPIHTAQGETTTLPAQTAAATGLPGTLSGMVKTSPGETVTKPDGTVISGIAKPLTMDEVKAIAFNQRTPAERRAVVMEPAGVAQIQGKDGEPTNVFKADSVGQTPYEKETLQPQNGNYKTADGQVGTATFSKDTKKWVDTQTGAELPPGAQIVSAPATQVNIDTKAPSEIEKAYGEGVGANIKTVMEKAAAAPNALADIGRFREALSRGGDNITTGPAAQFMLRGKQMVGGLFGTTLDGVPEAETINTIGFGLATQAAKDISSRPTQIEFGRAFEIKPGLAMSKPGALVALSIMEQKHKDSIALASLADDPANRAHWNATVQKYYADNPVMSPFDPSKPLGQADMDRVQAAAPADGAAPAVSGAPAASAAPGGPVTWTRGPDGKPMRAP